MDQKEIVHEYRDLCASADIGHLGAALKLIDDAVERRQPLADQIVVIPGRKKRAAQNKQPA